MVPNSAIVQGVGKKWVEETLGKPHLALGDTFWPPTPSSGTTSSEHWLRLVHHEFHHFSGDIIRRFGASSFPANHWTAGDGVEKRKESLMAELNHVLLAPATNVERARKMG
jgi:hypothetical protein